MKGRQGLREDRKVVLRFNHKQTANYTAATSPTIPQQREKSSSVEWMSYIFCFSLFYQQFNQFRRNNK